MENIIDTIKERINNGLVYSEDEEKAYNTILKIAEIMGDDEEILIDTIADYNKKYKLGLEIQSNKKQVFDDILTYIQKETNFYTRDECGNTIDWECGTIEYVDDLVDFIGNKMQKLF